jgi:pimeloyl-ACP methyl ester carboxylesterase
MLTRPRIVLFGLVLLVAACAPAAPSPSLSPSPSPTLTPAATATPGSSAGTGSISWSGSGSLQTGFLEVPRDYADPAGGTIRLALARRPALDPSKRIGTMLVNPGGPGGSGIWMVRYGVDALPSAVLDAFDIVGWDPRGVGASTNADSCPDPATARRIEALDPAPQTQAAIDANQAAYAAVATQCAAGDTALLPLLSTDESARDMDAIRVALGEEQISYYGASYGTFLGYHYATLFPNRLRAAVLDGAVDPTMDRTETNAAQGLGFEAALNHFLDLCAASTTCQFHGGADPAASYDALMAKIRQAPVPTGGAVALGPGQAWFGVLQFLYGNDLGGLAQALADAEAGDGSILLAAGDSYMSPQARTLGVFLAISCLDSPGPTSAEAIVADYRRLLPQAPRFGGFIGLDFGCLAWPFHHAPLESPVLSGLPPIVVIGSTGDPATPYANAASLATALGSGVVLTRDGPGHTAIGNGMTDCISGAVADYLLNLEAPAPGTTCADPPISFGN